jgi:hypothetical protein
MQVKEMVVLFEDLLFHHMNMLLNVDLMMLIYLEFLIAISEQTMKYL